MHPIKQSNSPYKPIECQKGNLKTIPGSGEATLSSMEVNPKLKNLTIVARNSSKHFDDQDETTTHSPSNFEETALLLTNPTAFYVVVKSFQEAISAKEFISENAHMKLSITKSITLGNWYHVVLPSFSSSIAAIKVSLILQKTNYPQSWCVTGSYFNR